ncbi:thiamine-phosphate diphosphorylase [Rubritalea squalenifaciens DSM 18772]|uniref:Thiamine-phosphate synthase n=1 Tax=Rubritalea squalenifaciens DSM 18772 TaxID=1123071 RepID=A0A1M6LA25_9BACT|nr:thiamine phosphate synthase [Rubritalea squalenifaciens]SHJ68024.1 thiamine-phosphate diphosphorylase [Rubritalea squalenifaciens DSM 18772]
MKELIQAARIYGILDLGYVAEEDVLCVAKSLLSGGVDVLQLRAKGIEESKIQDLAIKVLPLCSEAKIPFIVNDFPRIAQLVGADGVHIGQDDGSLAAVREIVGDSMIVGRSTHSPEQAQAALKEGFDYIGFGPLFPTPTKKGRPGIGLENVTPVQESVGQEIPVFCIGGIKRDNLELVVESGARRVVIVSDLLLADDVAGAVTEVRAHLNEFTI